MTDENNTPIDLDTLTDEQVLDLGPEQIQELMDQETKEENPDSVPEVIAPSQEETPISEPEIEVSDTDKQAAKDEEIKAKEVAAEQEAKIKEEEIASANDPDAENKRLEAEELANESESKTIVPSSDGKSDADKEAEKVAAVEAEKLKPGIKKETPAEKKASEETLAQENKDKEIAEAASALDFFKKVSAPFKADGKEINIRTPEDAIRLMQMGVNYSRRMQEMKPLRALESMLRENGLNDPERLNELIDLSKGTPEAVQKFLKDKNIDPLDIDTSKDSQYTSPDFRGDPKDIAFQDAIDTTLASDGGPELIQDVNDGWDEQSKEALKESPSIFQNLLDQKSSGVYGKIKTELEYQRTMGFFTNVPFLQAYHEVGDAMQKAGAFSEVKQEVQSIVPETIIPVKIDTGTRKAAIKPETVQPNPDLSSALQPVTSPSSGELNEPDYSSMSDADFLKMGEPV